MITFVVKIKREGIIDLLDNAYMQAGWSVHFFNEIKMKICNVLMVSLEERPNTHHFFIVCVERGNCNGISCFLRIDNVVRQERAATFMKQGQAY